MSKLNIRIYFDFLIEANCPSYKTERGLLNYNVQFNLAS